jgi:MFS family permease
MFAAIRSSWALFFGLALLMLGNGLQGTLLGVRASIEGFSTQTTGFVMTGYYVGFLIGSIMGPKLVKNVGHIRVFAALASILSAAMLLHSIFVEPVTWFTIRVMNGFAVAGLYVVVESWLNDAATNRTRGQLLSVYMVILLGGMAAGQFLLNVASPAGFELFILVSVLVSVSLVPISLSVTRAPKFETPAHVGWLTMYQNSPLGVVGCLIVGVAQATLLGMGAVYANAIGMSVADVSLFMAMALAGGVALQWPVGYLSDIFDRRVVITVVTILAAVVALTGALIGEDSRPILLAAIFLFGGLSFPLYSLCIAHSNDHLQPEQMIAASGTLILVAGIWWPASARASGPP